MEWILGILVVILILGYVLLIGPYNTLVRQRNNVQEAWRQVDVELNRRSDLIPNLVETVKGYATHEHNTLEDIVSLRNQALKLVPSQGIPTQARADVEQQLSGAVTQFLATAEAYPELKANANFQDLQRQLVETEDRISNGRRYYNAVVSDYNTRVEAFPSNLTANMFGFQRAGFFEVNDPTVLAKPDVSFNQIDYRGTKPQDKAKDDPTALTAGQPNPDAQTWRQPAVENEQPVGQPVTPPQTQQQSVFPPRSVFPPESPAQGGQPQA